MLKWKDRILAASLASTLILLGSVNSGYNNVLAEKQPERKINSISKPTAEYQEAIRKTSLMVGDRNAQELAHRYGLNIQNVTWEDTGHYKNSSVGPNISDMTIQVTTRDAHSQTANTVCMPVIRFDNYSDRTADLDPRDFTLLVGNQNGKKLKRISLYEFLEDPTAYLTHPESWKGTNKKSLLTPRDTKVLVSAQACFLPVPKNGTAEFNPVLFNYQSRRKDPAVLTLLVTREGTSATIIDNVRDGYPTGVVWGQRLFHNNNGQRATFTGQRESEFQAQKENNGPSVGNGQQNTKEEGLNMVLLIQIPLKQQPVVERRAKPGVASGKMAILSKSDSNAPSEPSDVENAVIGHGKDEGPYTEIDNLDIKRDDRFPVRVTVQFYKATSNGVMNVADIQSIKEQIDRVYAQSNYVGSLVTEGETNRITEYQGAKVQPADWWQQFWLRYEKNTGESREVAITKLRHLLGKNYHQRPVTDLYVRTLLKKKTA